MSAPAARDPKTETFKLTEVNELDNEREIRAVARSIVHNAILHIVEEAGNAEADGTEAPVEVVGGAGEAEEVVVVVETLTAPIAPAQPPDTQSAPLPPGPELEPVEEVATGRKPPPAVLLSAPSEDAARTELHNAMISAHCA